MERGIYSYRKTDERPKVLRFPEKHWPVSDLGNQPEMALKLKGSLMTTASVLPLSFLSRFNMNSSWTRPLGMLLLLPRFKGQLLVMKGVRPFGSACIVAINT